MPKIQYKPIAFRRNTIKILEHANAIIADYLAQGYQLTVRQLYYQFVARGLLANNKRNYDNLGGIISNGRLAGLIDWTAIEDRTRNLVTNSHWSSPSEIIRRCAETFAMDKWRGQAFRPEVWVEKEALAGIMDTVCRELDIPYFCCRGYTSQSEMWAAGMRLRDTIKRGQVPYILHFGDHDPSGLDMTRDIMGRLKMFMGGVKLDRVALNMDQIEEQALPPNPAKTTDSRFVGYVQEFGSQSWEIDALEPNVLAGLVRSKVLSLRDDGVWAARCREEQAARDQLQKIYESMG